MMSQKKDKSKIPTWPEETEVMIARLRRRYGRRTVMTLGCSRRSLSSVRDVLCMSYVSMWES